MAPPFVFPSNLKELEEDLEEEGLRVLCPLHVNGLHPSKLDDLVKGVTFDLSDRELFCIEEQDVFDRIYSLVKDFSTLAPSLKFNLVEALRSNLSVLLPSIDSLSRAAESSPGNHDDGGHVADRVASHRNALKIYSFFLLSIATSEESKSETAASSSKVALQGRKKHAVCAWNWEAQRGRIINLIANSLEINLSLLFGPGEVEDNYLSYISKCIFTFYENQTIIRDEEARKGLGRIVGTVGTKLGRTDQTCASILHVIHKFDYAVAPIADAVASAEQKYHDGILAVALIREIGRADPKDYVRDTAGAENVGRFLVELAGHSPRLVSTNVGVLVPHFGGESYKIRNALVGVLGKIVAKAFKDVEGDVSSKSLRLRGKNAMLEILLERCRDVSAYTRSRVLQVWAELCEEKAVSIGLWNEVASVAAGRLEDKSAIVRKSALGLLITLLQHNPFGPQLRVPAFEATLLRYKEKLHSMEAPQSPRLDGVEEGVEPAVTASPVGPRQLEESVSDSCQPDQTDTQEEVLPDMGNLEQIRALVASLEAGLRFSRLFMSLMTTLVQLLASPNVTDVENTILLLMRCRQFQIDGSDECLRKMLPLIFSQDKAIYEAVETAFLAIYIRKNPIETAKNLLSLTMDCSIGDLAALESLVSSLVFKGEISSGTISALWDFFSFNISGSGVHQSRGALLILCMAAKSSPSILGSHLSEIIDIGFGQWSKEDPLLARTACLALERLSNEDRKKLISKNSRVFGSLQNLIMGFWLPDKIWYTAVDKAITTIYAIHPAPEMFASEIVKRLHRTVFVNGVEGEGGSHLECLSSVPVAKLGRFLFIVSHVALNQLVYVESCVRKIQKQRGKKEKSGTLPENSEVTEAHSINAELGLNATVDVALDLLAERAEKEIISSGEVEKCLIGYCAPFLSKLCRNFNLLQKYPDLQSSAMLALCRLMIIDPDFCEANLQLLFTVAESAPSDVVRSNCTIAIGDLAVRFPNLLEPWTEFIYARLRDHSVTVRKNAILVISHLILNDMMKVKGYINEMATKIEDEDERISSLAKLFFHELSKKGSNPIYNLLPDILGRLCNQDLPVDSFYNIMQFLIGSIKKDKQMDALVEKLCNRFSGVNDVKQWECIAYCLSQLTLTERGFKKLIESFKAYEHALSEDSVLNHFRSIIAKYKKFAKADAKACVEEFEDKIAKMHEERKEQELTAQNAKLHQQRVGTLEGYLTKKKKGQKENSDIVTEDENGEVVDPPVQEETSAEKENLYKSSNLSTNGSRCGSTTTSTIVEEEVEVQSPLSTRKVTLKGKTKICKGSALKGSVTNSSVSRHATRSTRRS
ncbi:Condensin complex subunit 1 [Rhynchospora pubera]|uniref:Condensin-1 complex subunit CAP-D2 n=1 Tax=Rhynchospora pubera TaxID=906938 RepID=A0AAV8CM51_9POAL|nr:Condensin complex subunit 1 [Rhynchospora pubera]